MLNNTRLVFLRHGQAGSGQSDPLTPRGEGQVRILTPELVKLTEGMGPVKFYSSRFRRAQQSSEIWAKALGVPIINEATLDENAPASLPAAYRFLQSLEGGVAFLVTHQPTMITHVIALSTLRDRRPYLDSLMHEVSCLKHAAGFVIDLPNERYWKVGPVDQ